MADHLIPYVEFLGLPGSGKSYYSHMVADELRAEGYQIAEPSWELDHTSGKYARAIKKQIMTWLFTLCHHREAKGIKDVIRSCGVSNSEEKRFCRNVLYKAYLLIKRKEKVFFFDEGLAQMAVSLSVSADKTASQIYEEVLSELSLKQKAFLIRIGCSADTALGNMNQRGSHDSYVERLAGLEEKKEYLNRYEIECESITLNNGLVVTYSQDDSMVVTNIADFIKFQLNND